MYQVIARKYRPQSFRDVVSQEHVKTTLEHAIVQKRIAHGYIFSGQRGTGKTTVARILARCLNCVQGPTVEPCGVCASCTEIAAGGSVDVIEIDAASNRGINEMRELRENVRYQPARDRYKVFIVDEAHQITNEAFNALLKTIEEPPPWVVFVLCTTEAHKIPATIASRCQHFSFRSVDFDDLVARMDWICQQEGVEPTPEALSVLAQAGEGSVRDSLSALDQAIACCGGKIEAAEVRALLGAFSLDALEQITQALIESDSTRMLQVVDELERNGHNLQHFSRELARYFRNLLVARIAGAETRLIAASAAERQRLAATAAQFSEEDLTRYLHLTLELFSDLQTSLQPRFHLEIGLVRLVQAGKLQAIEEALANLPAGGEAPPPPRPKPQSTTATGAAAAPALKKPSPFEADKAKKTARPPEPQAPAPPSPIPHPPSPKELPSPIEDSSDWRTKLHTTLVELGMPYTADAVEHARVVEVAGELQITAPKELAMSLGEADIRKALAQLGGRPLRVKIAFEEGMAEQAPIATKQNDDELQTRALEHPEVKRFLETFPGGEVRQVRNLKE